jgi:predicted dehydrogenase
MVKVGIIGASGIAQVAHIPGYQKNDEVKIIGESESKLGISSQSMRKTSSPCFFRERR